MAIKEVVLPDVGLVKLYKRAGVRNIRITIHPDQYIRVTLPKWLPYKSGVDFVLNKQDWISQNQIKQTVLLDNQLIGKRHRLIFIEKSEGEITTHIKNYAVKVYIPEESSINEVSVQNAARNACKRALKKEGSEQLPVRLKQLSMQTGLNYKSVSVRSLKARWGSCSPKKEITLSIYLMKLPWELIDYVIIHELVHTKYLNHSPDFWQEFSKHIQDPKALRKQLRDFKPSL